MRQTASRARTLPVRALRREAEPGEPGPRCPAARRRPAPEGRRARPRIRARPVPPRGRHSPRSRALHKVRQAAGRRRPRVLRAVPGEETKGGPGEIRRREGGGEAVRRGRPRRQEKERPGEEQAPPEGQDRGGPLYPLRQAAPCRGRNHLPALPRQTPGGGSAGNTSTGARRGSAPGAERQRLTACRAALPVPPSRRPATTRSGRTRVRANSTPNGAPADCVRLAERRRRAPADAPLAPRNRITARRISGASRSRTRPGR